MTKILKIGKRVVCLTMVMLMMIACLPLNAFAAKPNIVIVNNSGNSSVKGSNVVIINDAPEEPKAQADDDVDYVDVALDEAATVATGNVAKVGNTEYATIDEAIANWTNGTTLTLLKDVTLSDVIKLSSTEYHILDLGTYTMTAATTSKKYPIVGTITTYYDAIEIVNNGRSSANYALDIKADATNPGGITASGKAVVKTTGKSGVKDRPIIRFYNGVFTGSNVVYHSGSNGTNCPQFQFHGGVFNGTIDTNRALNQFYGGTFNGKLQMSVDSSAYTLIAGGRFKYLSNVQRSDLDEKIAQGKDYYKFTIGSAKMTYDRGIYVDKEGYYVITSKPITELSAEYPAVYKTTYGGDDYFYYSAAATYGLFYEDAAMAIKNHGAANVTIWVKPPVTIPENVTGDADVIEEIKNNTALKDYPLENLPEGAELEIVLKSVGETFVFDVTPMANGAEFEPTEAITFRLPVPASVTKAYAKVYHEGELMGIYAIQGEGNAKYVEVSSADFSEYAVEPIVHYEVATYEDLIAALANDGAYVIMIADITATATQATGYGKAGIVVKAGVVLDGNGCKLTINGANGTWDCVIAMTGGEVKNLTISGAMRGVFMPGADGDVVIDSCNFEGVTYTFNSDAGSKDYTVTIRNTTLNGWTSFSNVHKEVIFDTCTFGEGNGYAFCRPYQATTFVGCEFEEGYELDTKQAAENTLVFNGCKYDDKALSADNNAMFCNGGSVVVDGETTDVNHYVAQIDNEKYLTLQAAINAVKNGETIKLLIDFEIDSETYTVADGKSITLDMNGKKITVTDKKTSNYELFYIYGELNVTGNGTIELTSENNREWNAMSAIFHNRGGVLTIENGTFTHKGGTDMAWVIDNSGNHYGDAVTNIIGGEFTCTYTAIRNRMEQNEHGESGTAILNISGGKITGTTSAIWAQAASTSTTAPATGKINISGGEIGLINTARSAGAECMTTISGGTVEGFKGEVGELTVTDGTISNVTVLTAAGESVDYVIDSTGKYVTAVAQVGEVKYASFEEAAAAAKAGDTITLLADVTLSAKLTLPAGITLNGNGKQINGEVWANGDLTFEGHTKVTTFNAGYNKPIITIGEGACLELTGSGRMVIGHGATFNITGNITDAKTANVADLTPSLIAAGASFTGAGVNFNVTNAYVKFTAYCSSKDKSASGTFNINVTNSIWEQTNTLVFSEPTEGKDPTFNFYLTNSVLNSTSHLVFAVTKGEIVFDNSNVNVGANRQLENRSTLTIKNGSVVYAAHATSSNAKNPGTTIVDNATYVATGEFTGSDVGTGTLVLKKDANVTMGKITKANIVIDAAGMTAGELANFTANLSKFVGELSVTNNDKLEAKIVDGKIVLSAKPVAKIGDTYYATLEEAFKAATDGCTIEILSDVTIDYAWDCRNTGSTFGVSVTINGNGHTIKFKKEINDGYNYLAAFRFNAAATVNNLIIDMSEAISVFQNRFSAIAAQADLTVNDCIFIGSTTYANGRAIIFGESQQTVGAQKISVSDSTFTNWKYGVVDNMNGKDTASEVLVTGNNFTNASVQISAQNKVTFTENTVETGFVKIKSYATATQLKVDVKDNTLTETDENRVENAVNYDNIQSGFQIIAAARVTNSTTTKYYNTLADAIAAAQAGDVVTVFEGTYAMPSMKADITIVGEGNVVFEGTLTGTLENLTLKNIHIKGGNAQRWAYAKGNLVFENVTFEATSVYALHFDGITEGTNLTYKNCTIIGWAAIGGSPASCVFESCTFKGNGTYGLIRTYFDATIQNCTFDVANVNTTDKYQDGIHAVEGANVTVTNCTNVNGDMKDIVNVHADSVVNLDGKKIQNVAKIGDTYYATLADAIAAADGKTVTILADVTLTEGLTIPAGKTITLDLNGKTVSMVDGSGAASALIKNNGILTIKDSGSNGKLTFNTTTPSANNSYASNTISNYGTIIIEGGIIENTSTGGACYALDNYAGSTATISGGTITAVKTAVRIFNWTEGEAAKATLNISGGEIITEKGYGINVNAGKTPYVALNISGGTITTNDTTYNLAVYVVNKGSAENLTINVTDGTFNGNFALNGITATTMKENAISISGGAFDGIICYDTAAYGFVSGGTFKAAVDEKFCASGFIPTDDGNGTYGVKTGFYVARVNGVGYETITEAIAAAENGNVVEILAGEFAEVITIAKLEKAITIQGAANFATTLTGGITIGVDNNVNDSGSITIKGIVFTGKGVRISDLANVTISDNKFSDITDMAAIYVQADNYTENVTISGNEITNVTGGAGIRVRSAKNITISGNTVAGTKDNSITLESSLEANNGSVVITNNKLSDWANNDRNEGRAIRISNGTGDAEKIITIEGNVMIANANATEEYAKITGATPTVSIDKNYWGGKNPNAENVVNVPAQANDYYKDKALTNLVTIAYVAEVNGIKYESFAVALAAAKTGNTITLLADVTEDLFCVPVGVTLDLNGHYITAGVAVLAYGSIIDTATTTGGIKIGSEKIVHLQPNNGIEQTENGGYANYMPLYDAVNKCYKFYYCTVTVLQQDDADNANRTMFAVRILFTNSEAYDLFAASGNKTTIKFSFTWEGKKNPMTVVFDDQNVLKQYCENAKKAANDDTEFRGVLRVGLNGIDKLNGKDIIGHVEFSSTTMVTMVTDSLSAKTPSQSVSEENK